MLDQILQPHSKASVMARIRDLDKRIAKATKLGDDIVAQILRTEKAKVVKLVEGRMPLNHLTF
jgi:hypothetical protein